MVICINADLMWFWELWCYLQS